MREWQSQSHVRWYCRYHVVWVPKYRNGRSSDRFDVGLGKSFGSCVSGRAWSWSKGTHCRITCMCCWGFRRSSASRTRSGS